MKTPHSTLIAALVAAALLPAAVHAGAAPAVVSSPDGRIAIRIERDATRFTVVRGGETVIAPSPLGLEQDGATPNDVVRVQRDVTASDVLTLKLASAGGAAVMLEPLAGQSGMAAE